MNLTCKVKNDILEKYICCADAGEGQQLPPIRALATELGVSAPTVCKAIEALSAEGHLVKRRGSGVFLTGNEGSPRFSVGKRIGIIVHSMTETLGHRVIEGAESYARRSGYSVEIAGSDYDCKTEAQRIQEMIRRRVDGIILYPVAKRDENLPVLKKTNGHVRIVVVDLYQESMKASRVIFDNYAAAYDMVSWLIAEGHKNILFTTFNHAFRHPAVEERERGFRQALLDAGVPFDGSQVYECGFFLNEQDTHLKTFLDFLDELYRQKKLPDAIMCTTDFIAAAVIAHFKRKNASVLDQVCVTGFDNNYFNPEIHHFEGLSARWPTTQPDFRRMGMEAARLLIDQIETGEADARVEKILSCPLLIPGSGTGG